MTAVAPPPPSPVELRLLAEIREHVDRMTVPTSAVLDPVASRAERRVAPTYPPLLSELRGAIRPSGTGRTSGAATSAPLPFDATALELLRDVEAGIAEMYRTATDVEPLGTSEQLLGGWFREFEYAHRDGELVEAQLRNYRDRVRSWRHRIEDFFAPPKQQEMPLCPRCGFTHEIVHIDGERMKRRCVVVTMWGDASRREPVVECRHCEARWDGFDAIRDLGAELTANVEHYGAITEVTFDPDADDDETAG